VAWSLNASQTGVCRISRPAGRVTRPSLGSPRATGSLDRRQRVGDIEKSRRAVETAELYVDGRATSGQLQTVRSAAHDVWHSALTSTYVGPSIQAEEAATRAACRLTENSCHG